MMSGINTRVQVYLNVPFKEKDQAKALGARFNPENKQWYVPHGVDITSFARWLPTDAAKFALGGDNIGDQTKKAKPKTAKIPALPTSALPELKPLLPANSNPDDPPWDT